ncbi:hypothetical protein F9278_22545 [Streptomyces phaeolivaceus]|uniref:Uncharacterized protein n=1 Tax=Streptomyces phaeolivaceus TaxID=2653200 RepID=A0A5P8K7H6_9ACTN|nr:hypothetical protein F9278_22545 [Streptomyces phaeolivaceus]
MFAAHRGPGTAPLPRAGLRSDNELAAPLIGHWMIGFQADQDLAWALLLEDGGLGGRDAGPVARAFLQKAQ